MEGIVSIPKAAIRVGPGHRFDKPPIARSEEEERPGFFSE